LTRILTLLISTFIISHASAHALCVKNADINLRKGPGTKYKQVGEAYKYTPLKKIKKQGKWYRVKDFENKVSWIHTNLVTDKFECAVVKDEEANIRTGPGTKHKEIDHSPSIRSETFKVLQRKGSWVKVEDEFGGTGWIFRKLLWIQ
jgi:SH3-like domain-containing protein